ncbi:glycoside hydrolase superfamily [Lophiotrema nucula]|uniref:Beta-hexosaminidase n=1 Tax=Lophiotrema nucula TaxID=690887 RepID=A0A6A5Z7M9_9PLEO|nr:glycoside hydrolase superfamily [Lophiotrema nucula]
MKVLFLLSFLTPLATAIWPLPVSVETGNTVLWIAEDVTVKWAGTGASDVRSTRCLSRCSGSYLTGLFDSVLMIFLQPYKRSKVRSFKDTTPSGDELVDHALQQTWKTIFKQSFVPWKFRPKGWKEPDSNDCTYVAGIELNLLKDDPENVAKPLAGEVDESYALSLTEDGQATVSANSSVGLIRGLNTFTQLFFAHSQGGAYTQLAPIEIFDAPKFQHRGINLDVSRNWFSVKDIKRTIDAVAYNKMNRFHLHITDSQSWPLEIPALPDLAQKGAYRPDLTYSPTQFRDIQYHAALQGVELITEIDMPGHTSSIWYSDPDLIAAFNIQPDWNTYAAEPPSGTLKLNSSKVADFLETLFNDLLPRVLPYTSYFHTGGDEVNKMAYTLDDTVKSSDPAVLQPLMQKFLDRNHDQVRSLGLTPIVWEEMLLDWNLTLGNDVIVQSWQSDEAVASIVEKGHKALVGNYHFWYLDCGKGQWLDFDPSVSSQYYPYEDYCAPFHNWRLIYSYDPLSGVSEDKQHLVVGGEAHMWAEQTDPVNLDRMVWPRGSAAAEVLWSGAKDAEGQNRSQIEASPRLSEFRERLVAKGIGAEPIQMIYCLQNGTQCQLGLS